MNDLMSLKARPLKFWSASFFIPFWSAIVQCQCASAAQTTISCDEKSYYAVYNADQNIDTNQNVLIANDIHVTNPKGWSIKTTKGIVFKGAVIMDGNQNLILTANSIDQSACGHSGGNGRAIQKGTVSMFVNTGGIGLHSDPYPKINVQDLDYLTITTFATVNCIYVAPRSNILDNRATSVNLYLSLFKNMAVTSLSLRDSLAWFGTHADACGRSAQ